MNQQELYDKFSMLVKEHAMVNDEPITAESHGGVGLRVVNTWVNCAVIKELYEEFDGCTILPEGGLLIT